MRVPGKGLIDRDQPLEFSFDGVSMQGFLGDTLASALVANGVKLVGRSFKYHRPRGIFSAGSEEPNALVTIGDGAQSEPNIRASVQELYDGLAARPQNAWPTLNFDLLSLNDLLAPFIGAGFYYKTFMWPPSFWEKLYEPVIRKAAGLGALSGLDDPDRYDRSFAFCDLLVIGAGPCGLMAALTAGRAGLDVILADEGVQSGGQLLSETFEVDNRSGALWAESIRAELDELPNVRVMTRTTVTSVHDGGTYGALERVGRHRADRATALDCFWRIVAKRSILAAGSLERPIAFPNNDRPGIMTAGAVRAYLNRWGAVGGKSVTIFTNNDDAYRTARDLKAAGVHVAAVLDSRDTGPEMSGVDVIRGAQVIQTQGRKGISAVRFRTGSGEDSLHTDLLAVSGGWNPSVHLTCHLNGRPEWSAALQAFVPKPGAVPGMIAAGACNGAMSTAACLADGHSAAVSVVTDMGKTVPSIDLPEAEDDPYRITALWSVPGKGRAWLDLQNDVTVKDVTQSAGESFRSVEHMKRYTTQGMATDQGKTSNVGALAVLADVTGRTIPETGTTTFRPPFTPVPIAAMGAPGRGMGFAPERFLTTHDRATASGAPTVEAGLWHRPSYFPREGEISWRQSCDREVAMVRNAVGICDVSTLGKVDIQGSDAGTFLDFVYTNVFSSLPIGRVRYGLMLREDGHVMDDGTTARLDATHYLMTTTTGAAGPVMRHLEFAHQVLRPELDVSLASVTDHWAQFAVAGPKAREVLGAVLDAVPDLAFMGCAPVSVGGVPGRLFRISFAGGLGFELAIPARFGGSLYDALLAAAEPLGGGPYGLEALNVLRLEKGFITHAEIDGRATAFDIGMQRMMSDKKDFIGKALAARPGLMDPDRPRLVGLVPVGTQREMTAGAHLFGPDDEPVASNDQGFVTSVAYSPTLDTDIALGFLKRGPERYGETVRLVDHMRGVKTLCVVQRLPFWKG